MDRRRAAVRVRQTGRLFVRGLDPLATVAEKVLRRWAKARYFGGVEREWFDHRAHDYLFKVDRSSHWAERGVYSRELIPPGGVVLDLACGDGFYPYRFYSTIASHIDGMDLDPEAIRHARRHHQLPNISYQVGNVVSDPFPRTRYDAVTWDGAIEHFTDDEVLAVLDKVTSALAPGGKLGGMTIVGTKNSPNPFHDREFTSPEQLERLLGRRFAHVQTFVREHPDRKCLYFRAWNDT